MRYRIGEDPGQLGPPAGDDLTTASAVFGLIIGAGFVLAGIRGRQTWLSVWGGGLVVASLAYLGALITGYV